MSSWHESKTRPGAQLQRMLASAYKLLSPLLDSYWRPICVEKAPMLFFVCNESRQVVKDTHMALQGYKTSSRSGTVFSNQKQDLFYFRKNNFPWDFMRRFRWSVPSEFRQNMKILVFERGHYGITKLGNEIYSLTQHWRRSSLRCWNQRSFGIGPSQELWNSLMGKGKSWRWMSLWRWSRRSIRGRASRR